MAVNPGRILGPRVWRVYHDDALNEFRVNIDEDFATAAELGFGPDDASRSELPPRAKMRHVYATGNNGVSDIVKKLPCGNTLADAYMTGGTVVNIDGVDFTCSGHIGEIMPNLP